MARCRTPESRTARSCSTTAPSSRSWRDTTYLINHSLGRHAAPGRGAPRRVRAHVEGARDPLVGRGLVGDAGQRRRPGRRASSARRAGSTVMHQNVAVAEAVVLSCFLPVDPRRNRVVYERGNFPSVRYLYQAQPRPRGRRLRERRGDRRRDRRADAARPDQPRALQDRRDPEHRADHPPRARGRRARDPRLLPVRRDRARSTSRRSASTSPSAAR